MNEKEKHYFKIFACVGVVALVLIGFVFWESSNVPNDSARAERVAVNIQRVGEHQQNALQRLETIEGGLGESGVEVGYIKDQTQRTRERIETSEGRLVESSKLIERGQKILRGIQERAETEVKN